MEIRLDRDATAFPDARTSPAALLLFPLESTVVELAHDALRWRLDRASFALLPRRVRYRLECASPAPKLLTLLLSGDERARAEDEYAPHVERARMDRVLGAPRMLPRTRWVDELVHRYVFERTVCQRHDSDAARFCECELMKELYFLGQEHAGLRTRAPVVHRGRALVERARAAIEAELFAPFSTAQLAQPLSLERVGAVARLPPRARPGRRRRTCASAVSTRRCLLIESGRYSIGEVAERVGYRGQAAFAAAFHKKFRVPPSQVLKASRERR